MQQDQSATKNIAIHELPISLTVRLKANLINYRSAIALALASKQNTDAAQIAQQLTYYLQQQLHPNLIRIQDSCSGWVDFTLTETAIQQWLQACLTPLPTLPLPFSATATTLSFPQYIHDRCCRLLQLGAQENLIALTAHADHGPNLPLTESHLLQTEDWRFVYQLIQTTDRLEHPCSSQTIAKLVNDLSEAFTRFHRYCRIFDRQQSNFPQIAAMRLHLIALAQKLLHVLID